MLRPAALVLLASLCIPTATAATLQLVVQDGVAGLSAFPASDVRLEAPVVGPLQAACTPGDGPAWRLPVVADPIPIPGVTNYDEGLRPTLFPYNAVLRDAAFVARFEPAAAGPYVVDAWLERTASAYPHERETLVFGSSAIQTAAAEVTVLFTDVEVHEGETLAVLARVRDPAEACTSVGLHPAARPAAIVSTPASPARLRYEAEEPMRIREVLAGAGRIVVDVDVLTGNGQLEAPGAITLTSDGQPVAFTQEFPFDSHTVPYARYTEPRTLVPVEPITGRHAFNLTVSLLEGNEFTLAFHADLDALQPVQVCRQDRGVWVCGEPLGAQAQAVPFPGLAVLAVAMALALASFRRRP